MQVRLLDLTEQYQEIRDEIGLALGPVLDSQQFILGPEVEGLEGEVAAYCHCSHGIGVSSGTDALLAALMAIDVGPGDEVITTAYSFFATAGCVARLGAKPVFVDILPDSYNLDPDALEAALTPTTKAVLPVHLFGQTADMSAILAFAERHGLPLIEDAAQAIGADFRGHRAGSMGLMGCFSFFPSKNLGGFGDGGMVTTNDDTLAERLTALRNHGMAPRYHHGLLGGNFRLDALQAAVLRVKLRYLERWHDLRTAHAESYRQHFAAAGLSVSPDAGSEPGAAAPVRAPTGGIFGRHTYHQFVIGCDRRDDLQAFLAERGVATAIYYPIPLHLQACFSHFGYRPGDMPVSEAAAATTLALPIYPELAEEAIRYVVGSIAEFYS